MQYFAYSQKEFVYKYVVMLSDTDQFRHMSFANYLKLMFLATDALFLDQCDAIFLSQSRLALVDSRMQFKRQTVVGDHILIKVNSTNVTTDKFTLLYTFVIEASGELVALGRQTYHVMGAADQSAKEIPRKFRNCLDPIQVEENFLVYTY